MKKKYKLQTNTNFFSNAFESLGFNGESMAKELIDNAIDAEATEIHLGIKSNEDNDFKEYSISDNGNSFDNPIEGLGKKLMTLGSVREYTDTDIGNFGLGGTSVINHSAQNGGEPKIIATDKQERSAKAKVTMVDKLPEMTIEEHKPHFEGSGTEMILPNILTSTTEDKILKKLKVDYYPAKEYGINIYLKNKGKVDFVDPFYRDLDSKSLKGEPIIKDYLKDFTFESEGGKNKMELFGRGLFPKFTEEHEDRINKDKYDKTRSESAGWLKKSQSGLYIQYGKRYICTGLKPTSAWTNNGGWTLSGLRIELRIPKYIKDFPIMANKSQINFSEDNPLLSDLWRAMGEIIKDYHKDFKNVSTNQTSISTTQKKKLQKLLNSLIRNTSKINTLPQTHGKYVKAKFPEKGFVTDGTRPRTGENKGQKRKVVDVCTLDYIHNEFAPWISYKMDESVVYLELNERRKIVRDLLKQPANQQVFFLLNIYLLIYASFEKTTKLTNPEEFQENFQQTVEEMGKLADKVLKD